MVIRAAIPRISDGMVSVDAMGCVEWFVQWPRLLVWSASARKGLWVHGGYIEDLETASRDSWPLTYIEVAAV